MFDSIRNKLVPFIIMALFAIMAAMLPEILGDHAKNMLEKYLGPSYPIILIVCFLLLFILVVSIKAGHFFQHRSFKKIGYYEIAGTDANRQALQNAKNAVGNDEPEDAIKLLTGLQLEVLESELSSLSARLNRLKRTQIHGTESFDTINREQNKINRNIQSLINGLEKELSESFAYYESIRASLKERYEKRLSQKLSRRQPVNLRLAPSTKGSSQQAAAAFIQFSEEEIPDRLIEYFKKSKERLLLVGAPGSGKTTLLLQLVLELLDRETTYLPVILSLARWSNNFRTLEEWMQEILPSELGLMISKKAAANLIAQNRLILLLDGLDEVAEEDREVCLTAIGNYGLESDRRFVISSRISEYEKIRKSAPVHSQVEVGPLTISQLEEQLAKADIEKKPESRRFLAAVRKDSVLRSVAAIPFFFNTLQILFAKGIHLDELNFKDSKIEGRKAEIIECFVHKELEIPLSKHYNSQKARKYLSFFSSQLTQNNLVNFELINLQYAWCKSLGSNENIGKLLAFWGVGFIGELLRSVLFGVIVGLSLGLIAGIIYGTGIGFFYGFLDSFGVGLSYGVFWGLFFGLSLGGFIGLVNGLDDALGKYTSIFSKNKGPTQERDLGVNTNKKDLVFQLIYGLSYGMAFGLTIGLLINLVNGLLEINQINYLTPGLIVGFFFGIAYFLLIGINHINDIPAPIIYTMDRIRLGWSLGAIPWGMIALLMLLFGLVFGLRFGLAYGVFFGLTGGFSGIIIYGLLYSIRGRHLRYIQINTPYQRFRASAKVFHFSILQHWHLRYLLSKMDLLPWKLVSFLNDMVEHNILESDGASWRFRHRILQDYFAAQWMELQEGKAEESNLQNTEKLKLL